MDEAVRAALRLFIARGYEGASSGELAAAMGINPPSLHAAFGNKEGLFRRAVEAYGATNGSIVGQACSQRTSRAAVGAFMLGSAVALTAPSRPPRLPLRPGRAGLQRPSLPIREELARRPSEAEPLLGARFEGRAARGRPAGRRGYVSTVAQGMAVQASGGATRAELEEVVEAVLDDWPGDAATAG